jgi:hypothetical protein
VAPYDRAAVTARLRERGVTVVASADKPDVLRFRDNNGITVESHLPGKKAVVIYGFDLVDGPRARGV